MDCEVHFIQCAMVMRFGISEHTELQNRVKKWVIINRLGMKKMCALGKMLHSTSWRKTVANCTYILFYRHETICFTHVYKPSVVSIMQHNFQISRSSSLTVTLWHRDFFLFESSSILSGSLTFWVETLQLFVLKYCKSMFDIKLTCF